MKVAILGTAPGSRLIAPWDDEAWQIWVCSAGNSQAAAPKRITKWFELHAICDMMGYENQAWCKPYFQWLRSSMFPVYMQEKNEYIPQAVIFPYKKMCERFGPNSKTGLTNWFTSSVAWMMAFAIDQMRPTGERSENGDEIAIFGVDMAATEENYTAQKAGCLRFCEIATSLGIKVSIPFESCLGKAYPLYGYSEATNMGRKMRVREHEMKQARAQIDMQVRQGELQRAFFDGALESVSYDIRTWLDGSDAELDDNGVNDIDVGVLKDRAKQYAEKQIPLTREFTENSAGVFVPMGAGTSSPTAIAASAMHPAPPPQPTLPEGSTVSVDADGKRHYGMEVEPVRIKGGGNRKRKSKASNGLAAEI